MRILVAEDERELSDALCMILNHNRYAADAVYDGAEALDYISSGQYDCVILDIMMPKLDGLEVLRRVRANRNDVPILLLTARSGLSDRISGLDLGADDYLTKPFDMGELLARLRAISRRRSNRITNATTYGDITLNREQYTLAGPYGLLHLGSKEYQILEILLDNPNRVVSSEQFLSKVWGYDADIEINGVWVYISGLRKKLQKIGSRVEIRSNRGVGYVLAVRAEGGQTK